MPEKNGKIKIDLKSLLSVSSTGNNVPEQCYEVVLNCWTSGNYTENESLTFIGKTDLLVP
jgi:hypothetical protein